MRAFRFGYQVGSEASADELIAAARSAEQAGFDVIHTWDHVVGGAGGWSALAPLVGMAAATTRLRVGPLVLNNDYHHPVHLHLPRERLHHFGFEKNQLSMLAWQAYRNAQTRAVFAPRLHSEPTENLPLIRSG